MSEIPNTMERKRFLFTTALGLPLLVGAVRAQVQAGNGKPPRLPADLVRDFVRVGHGELDEVERMLAEEPGLLNACYDWGGGDFETALEGAGHVGSREVAEFLLARGARPKIFVRTSLGPTNVVKAQLAALPHLLRSKGPHWLTLLHHAQRGGEAAAELLEHIRGLGLTETKLAMP